MTTISAVVPDELATILKLQAQAEDRSASSVLRRALAEHLTVLSSRSGSSPSRRVPGPSSVRQVASQLGHSRKSLTLDPYSHALMGD